MAYKMRKIIGIGETVLDIIFREEQPVSAIPGGSTYNSIVSVGRSGIPAEFISETGDDRVGRRIMSFLEENGVSSRSICVHKGQKSALSLAFLNDRNDAEYVFYKDHANDRLEFVYPQINPDDIVLFGSFYAINDVVRHQVKAFLDYASAHGAILYYDVNFRASHKGDAERLMPNIRENMGLADIVRGSHEDFEILFGLSDGDAVYTSEILPYAQHFIYTRGGEPAELRTADNSMRRYAPKPVQTVSTIGAGDSFNAGLAYGLIRYGISREQLRQGLSVQQWDRIFACAFEFAANVCQSIYNYIDTEFGQKMHRDLMI
jgi:fructokinase